MAAVGNAGGSRNSNVSGGTSAAGRCASGAGKTTGKTTVKCAPGPFSGRSSFEAKTAKTAKTGKSTKSTKSTKASQVSGTRQKTKGLHAQFTGYVGKGTRSQMALGKITVNGRTYHFASGGGGKGNLPKGKYTVSQGVPPRKDQRTMFSHGVGYKFNLTDKFDPRVGAKRTDLRIHPDGMRRGTIGCIGIQGDARTQRQFEKDLRSELARNGGRISLTID